MKDKHDNTVTSVIIALDAHLCNLAIVVGNCYILSFVLSRISASHAFSL